MPRIAPADADAAIARPQPVAEADLAWGQAYLTVWDGTIFQVLRYRLDENGERTFDVDDDGVQWAGLEWDEQATAAAAKAYQDANPDPDEVKLREAAARA